MTMVDEDETPTPRETPLRMSAVSPYEEIQAIASELEPRWQRALVVQARRMLRRQWGAKLVSYGGDDD